MKAEIKIIITDLETNTPQIAIGVDSPQGPALPMMIATEYMMHNFATNISKAGYEACMEKLVKGAMTYRNVAKKE